MPCETRIVRSAEEIAELEPVWRRCFLIDPYATIFQSYEWNLSMAEHLPHIERPLVICSQDADGNATIVPAAESLASDCLTLLGECLSDYRSILTTDASSPTIQSAFLALANERKWLLYTALLPEHHAVLDEFSTEGFCGAPHKTPCPGSEFAARHGRMFSRLRKLERHGFDVVEHDGSDEQLVRWIYARKSQADEHCLFRAPHRVNAIVTAFRALASKVRVFTLRRDGLIIAAVIVLIDSARGFARFYTNWFDADWRHFSPGMVLLYEASRRVLDAGLGCDYLTGEQPYKLRMADCSRYLRRVKASPEELRRAGGSAAGIAA